MGVDADFPAVIELLHRVSGEVDFADGIGRQRVKIGRLTRVRESELLALIKPEQKG